ncbi:MAG: hypothetical protein CM15mP45_17550 [Deltaproteobacteria bacterium]|nr:MAG: hypothetical protein CM15mP45_17550 [Deltaproteobacteria bacterium]
MVSLKKGFKKIALIVRSSFISLSMAVKGKFGFGFTLILVPKKRKLSEPRGRTRFLTDDEKKRLLISCENSKTKELLIIVLFALLTGLEKKKSAGFVGMMSMFKLEQ